MMATSKTGLVHGTMIELDSAVPEMEGKRVRVVLEVVDEPRISPEQQRELWQAWAERGPQDLSKTGPTPTFRDRARRYPLVSLRSA
jgi:hypothetical protein